MDLNEIAKMLAKIKPMDEQRKDLNRQIKSLNKEQLEMLSPLIEEIDKIHGKMPIDEYLKKAEEIKTMSKNAYANNNNK